MNTPPCCAQLLRIGNNLDEGRRGSGGSREAEAEAEAVWSSQTLHYDPHLLGIYDAEVEAETEVAQIVAAVGQQVAKAATLSVRLKEELQESANERQAKMIQRDEERARRQQVRDVSFEHGVGGLDFKVESASTSKAGAKGNSAWGAGAQSLPPPSSADTPTTLYTGVVCV
jgi:hypothetical protein